MQKSMTLVSGQTYMKVAMQNIHQMLNLQKRIFKYCTCTADQVTKQLDVKELVLLESSMLKEKSEEDQVRVMMANKKLENIIADCISKIIN